MTLQSNTRQPGRRLVTIVEVQTDYCYRTYGSSPCLAAVGVTGPDKCFNSITSCQYPSAFLAPDAYRKSFFFSSDQQRLQSSDRLIFPCVRNVSITASKIDLKGVGPTGSVSISMSDFPVDDAVMDKYSTERSYRGTSRLKSTFWAKFLARHPYYHTRPLNVYQGALEPDGTVNLANLVKSAYMIEKITGPDTSGNITVTAKDVMMLLDDARSQIPVEGTAYLQYAMNATDDLADGSVATVFEIQSPSPSLLPPGVLADGDFDAFSLGFKVDDEIVYGYRPFLPIVLDSSTGMYRYIWHTTVVRGAFGTIATTHAAGAKATMVWCYGTGEIPGSPGLYFPEYPQKPKQAILAALHASAVPPAYIDDTQIGTELDTWVDQKRFWYATTKATSARKILQDLCEQLGCMLYYDSRAGKIRVRCLRPPQASESVTVSETTRFVGSIKVERAEEDRVSQVWYYYGAKKLEAGSSTDNYTTTSVFADLASGDIAGPKYRSDRIRKIYGSLSSTDETAVPIDDVASRIVACLRETPLKLTGELDLREYAVWIGSALRITVPEIVDLYGNPKTMTFLVTEAKIDKEGDTVSIIGYNLYGNGEFAVYMEDGSSGWSPSSPVPAGYYADDNGLIDGGAGQAYLYQ